MDKPFRIEHDTLGDVNVPADALYGAQTQRAVNNFNISGLTTLAGLYLVDGSHQACCS